MHVCKTMSRAEDGIQARCNLYGARCPPRCLPNGSMTVPGTFHGTKILSTCVCNAVNRYKVSRPWWCRGLKAKKDPVAFDAMGRWSRRRAMKSLHANIRQHKSP